MNADTPTEAECRPYIAKALNTLKGDNKGIKQNKRQWTCSVCDVFFFINCLEPDSAEIVVDVDDSKEDTSKEDDAVVTEDDNSTESKIGVDDDNDDDDSQEGIECDLLFFFLLCHSTNSF